MSLPRRHRRLSRPTRLVAALAALLLLFAACGDDDTDAADGGETPTADDGAADGGADGDGGAPAGDADVTVVAEDIDFPTKEFAAGAGEITIEYVNEDSIRHTLVIEGVDDWDTLSTTGGDRVTGTIELEPGEYTLFCDVPGHRPAGMEGTLTVS